MKNAMSFVILIIYTVTTSGCLYTQFSPPGSDAKVVTRPETHQDPSLTFSNNRDQEKNELPPMRNNSAKEENITGFGIDAQQSDLAAERMTENEHLKNGIQLYRETYFDEAIIELNIAIQVGLSDIGSLADAYGYLALCTFGKDQNDVYSIKEYLKKAIMSDTYWEPNIDDYNPVMYNLFREVKAGTPEINTPKNKLTHNWLGIQFLDINANTDIAKKYVIAKEYGRKTYEGKGILVMEVFDDSPAQKAGIQKGDLITEFNGNSLKDGSQLRELISTTKLDEIVNIKTAGDYEVEEFRVQMIQKTDEDIAKAIDRKKAKWLGITVQEINDELAKKLGYNGYHGVLINDIANDSPVINRNVRPLDLIQVIDFDFISDIQDFKRAIESNKDYNTILLELRRSITETWHIQINK